MQGKLRPTGRLGGIDVIEEDEDVAVDEDDDEEGAKGKKAKKVKKGE